MGTVSENIDTLISNVQNAASEMTSAILSGIDEAYNYLPNPSEFGVLPVVSNLPPSNFVEPTGLLAMLTDARTSLAEIGADIPLLSTLAGATGSEALTQYMLYADKYKALIQGRMGLITDVMTRAFPIAGYVKYEAEVVNTSWSSALLIPTAAAVAFSSEVTTRALETSDVLYQRALIDEKILQSNVDAATNHLAVRSQLLEVLSLLGFANSALQGAYAVVRKTIVAPEDVLRIFKQLADARTSVATGIANNRAAYAGTQMEYVNALVDYYDLFGELEKVRLDVAGISIERDSQYKALKATQFVGAASAAAHIAAAGYSAARVGFVLSEKAFS